MTDEIDVEELVRVLDDGRSSAEQKEVLEGLADRSFTRPEPLVSHLDAICSRADSEDAMVRSHVSTVLVNVAAHEPSAVVSHAPIVRELLADDYPNVLSFATTTAMIIASESPDVLFDATDRLLDLVSYENVAASRSARDIRLSAASTLGRLGEADSAIAARADEPLTERLDDSEAEVRRAAVTALTRLGKSDYTIAARADTPLAARLNDSDAEVRAAAVTAFTRLGLAHPAAVPTGLDRLPERLGDEDKDVRRNAIKAYLLFRRKQPAAIAHPGTVAQAFRETATEMDLDSSESDGIAEICTDFEKMAADRS